MLTIKNTKKKNIILSPDNNNNNKSLETRQSKTVHVTYTNTFISDNSLCVCVYVCTCFSRFMLLLTLNVD
jgi:hypothetical protein